MLRVAIVAALAGAPLVGAPAGLASPVGDTASRVLFDLCPSALGGTFDMNDAAALRAFGLFAAPESFEAKIKVGHPGTEMAGTEFPDGLITVGVDRLQCNVLVSGAARIAAHDELIAAINAHGGRLLNDERRQDIRFEDFVVNRYRIVAQTSPDTFTVSMRRLESN